MSYDDMLALGAEITGSELSIGVLCGFSSAAALSALVFVLYLRWRKLPESLIPNVLLDNRVRYHDGLGTYEARPGNAM